MSKRRNGKTWRGNLKQRMGGKRRNNALRSTRLNGFEQLEVRQMLSVDPIFATTDPNNLQAALDLAVDKAFQRSARLSQYTAAELENSTRWVVKTNETIHAGNFTQQTGLAYDEAAPTNNTHFALAGNKTSAQIIETLSNNSAVKYFYPEVGLRVEKHSLPDDPLLRDQWHLRSTGQLISLPNEVNNYTEWGADLRADEAWSFTTGDGVTVGVVDDGIFYVHPDLAPNYDPSLGFDVEDGDNDPSPNATDQDFHGTAVAGIIGAKGDNGVGVSGVAPDVTLGGIRIPFSDILGGTFTDQSIYEALTHRNDVFDIKNNSWGSSQGRAITTSGPFQVQAMIDSLFLGRDGLGTILVNASGNSGEIFDLTNHDDFASRIYTIAISGFGPDGGDVDYAEGGTSVFATAPTGANPPNNGILTTDLTGDLGYNAAGTDDDVIFDVLEDTDYTAGFNGTSAASPAAAGVVALIVGAARANDIELSVRDVKHILARSSRRLEPLDVGWQTDLLPLFHDPATEGGVPYGASVPNGLGLSAIPWMIDETGTVVSDTAAQFANATNAAGFFVHDGVQDARNNSYGHGAVDAAAAVKLAMNWQSVGTQHVTSVSTVGLPTGLIPSAEVIDPNIRIPGAFGGFANRDFAEFYDLWLNPPDEVPEDLPTNGRGNAIPIAVPANMTIEEIEVNLEMTIPPDASEFLRINLVSPDGVHSELTNFIHGGDIGPTTIDGIISHTFTTNQHWGERSEGVGRIDPLTGERIEPNVLTDANGKVTHGVWQLFFENWSDEDATLDPGSSINFHGVDTPVIDFLGDEFGGRIQGSIGLDTNQDGEFNVTGITAAENMIDTEVNGIAASEIEIISGMDTQFEPMVAGVTVYVDIDKDGVRDASEPWMVTGADGNYYFDLPWNQPGNSYEVRFELPDGHVNLGPEVLEYVIGIQDDDSVISTHADGHFLFEPEPIVFEGNVFADFNGNAEQDLSDATAQEFRVFVDLNENGKLDFIDVNANNVFDNGIDEPLEPMAITGPDGSYSVEVSTDFNVRTDFFGNDIFLNDWYLGSEYYTLMLDARDGWEPTGLDVSAAGFASPLLTGQQSRGMAFHRMFVEAGETMADLDFSVAPDQGSISGFVFNDLNENGTRQSGEGGLGGFTVYLDTDNSVQDAIDAGADPADPATYDTAEQSIITGDNGNYLFENLAAGVYDLYVTPGPGFDAGDQTHPIGGAHLNKVLDAGEHLGSTGLLNFGFFDPDAVLVVERDYGDLDGPYATTDGDGGPSHGIVDGYHLGAGITADDDGQPSSDADADAMDDGVTLLSPVVAGDLIRLDVEASTDVLFLQGWIDFNNDGDFNDEGEHLAFRDADGDLLPFAQQPRLESGTNQLSFIAPDEVTASTLAARFRYGEGGHQQFNQPNGPAMVGEVEDYMVPASISTSFIEPLVGDFNQDNVVDQGDYAVWKQTYGSTLDLRADANADGTVDLADFTLWRDNLGAEAQPVQTIMATSTAGGEETLEPSFLTVSDGQVATYQVAAPLQTESSTVQAAPETSTTAAVDLAFYEAEDETGDVDLAYESLADDGLSDTDDALVLAIEEEFGDLL